MARRKLEGLTNAGRDFRQELSKSILDYCQANPDTDKLIVLQDLTGQKDFRYVTPELAQKGLEKFNKEYKTASA